MSEREPSLRDHARLFRSRLEQWKGFRKCGRCGLPEAFRDMKIAPDGKSCNFCERYLHHVDRVADGSQEAEMEALIDQFRERASASDYDAIVCYSGGKDSTTLLDLFKNRYGLRVLAVTMCTGVNNPTAKENVAVGTKALGVDHHWMDCCTWLMDIYRWGFQAHSDKGLECDVCDLCDEHTRRSILELAIQRKIPMIVHGMDHFQLIDSGLTQGSAVLHHPDACWPAVARSREVFRDRYRLDLLGQIERPPLELYPFLYLPYNEMELTASVEEKGLVVTGDPDETNCDFVFLMNILEFLRHGYPAYIHTVAASILQGEVTLEESEGEVLEWLEEYGDGKYDEQVFLALPRLGLTMEQLIDPGPVVPCTAESVRGTFFQQD